MASAPGASLKSNTMNLSIDDEGNLGKTDIDFSDTLRKFLSPYLPVARTEADKFFTTSEIVSKIEQHYGLSTSNPKQNNIYGPDVVVEMHALGFREENVGGQMQWIMKKKI